MLDARRVAATAALVLLAAGCAVVKRPPTTVAQLEADRTAATTRDRATVATMVDALALRAIRRGDRTIDILLLSGGGQNGSYGIGFLRGWRGHADAPMPRFDLVTGVSSGALQAPFALIGTEASLAAAAGLYRDAVAKYAPTFDWFFWLFRTGGVLDTTRYRRAIETVFDREFAGRLGEELAEGRQLALSTTDLDLGTGRLWNLGAELGPAAQGLERVHSLMLATSAIPGIFPPVVVDGHVHADGGFVGNLVPVLDFDGYRALAARLTELGVKEPVTVRVWVVMNLWTTIEPTVVDPASRRGVSRRGTLILFWSQQAPLLAALADLSRAVTSSVPGLRVEIRSTSIPSHLALDPAADRLFDAGWMEKLEKLGFERASSAAPWDEVISR